MSDSTIRNFRIVRQEGKRLVNRNIDHYNLDVIISVGYRVNSKRGSQFRIWANDVLKEYLVKGYTFNEKRLAQKEHAKGLSLLDDYDHEQLDVEGLTQKEAVYPSLKEYQILIYEMVAEFDLAVFGKEKDDSFQGYLNQMKLMA